jgi:hypothetical protein
MSPLSQAMTMGNDGLLDGVSRPASFDEQVTGVCHSDLPSGNDTSPKAITCAPTLLLQRAGSRVLFHPDFDRRLRPLT